MTTSATPSMVARVARVVWSLGLIGFLIATVVPFATRGGSAWERRMLENALLWPVGVQRLLIGSGHLFSLDRVADSIGWPGGNPVQFEVGLASISFGVLGFLASGHGQEWWFATIVAFAISYVGAAVGHVREMLTKRNFSPGNAGPVLILDLGVPLLLIILYLLYHRRYRTARSHRRRSEMLQRLIDTHVHHWDLDRFRYPWLDDPSFDDLRVNYLPADYRADAARVPVEGWVHVQAELDHQIDPVTETAWISTLADEAGAAGAPGPLACVVYADLRATDLREILARHSRYPLTRGVRQEAWFDPASMRADIPRDDLLSEPAWREGYGALADFGLSFDLLVWPSQLPQAAAIAADTPAVPVVLEHLGLPDPAADTGLRTWRAGVATLAQLPHAHVKLSAFSWLGNPRNEPSVRAVVSELLELFGPQRCMVGSNFPVERLAGGFTPLHELILTALQDLSDTERADVLVGTARRFYRLRSLEDCNVAKGRSGD